MSFVAVSGRTRDAARRLVDKIKAWLKHDLVVTIVLGLANARRAVDGELVVVFAGKTTTGIRETGALWLHATGEAGVVPEGAVHICDSAPDYAMQPLVCALVRPGPPSRSAVLRELPGVLMKVDQETQRVLASAIAHCVLHTHK